MNCLLLLFLVGMIIPAYAQESTLNETPIETKNAKTQEDLDELKNVITEIKKDVNNVITEMDTIKIKNIELNNRLLPIENGPSFEEQLVSSEKYSSIMDRLNEMETQRSIDEQLVWIQIISGIATAGAFGFLGYQTLMNRSEKKTYVTCIGKRTKYRFRHI